MSRKLFLIIPMLFSFSLVSCENNKHNNNEQTVIEYLKNDGANEDGNYFISKSYENSSYHNQSVISTFCYYETPILFNKSFAIWARYELENDTGYELGITVSIAFDWNKFEESIVSGIIMCSENTETFKFNIFNLQLETCPNVKICADEYEFINTISSSCSSEQYLIDLAGEACALAIKLGQQTINEYIGSNIKLW